METFFEDCKKKMTDNSHPNVNGQCIDWNGTMAKSGYGQFCYRDPRDPAQIGHRTKTAHRMALLIHVRNLDIPPRLQASHLCDQKLCVNTDHLAFEKSSVNNLRKTIPRCDWDLLHHARG